MTSTEQLRWARVRDRLRAEVGEDVYSSWFARMELKRTKGLRSNYPCPHDS